MTLTSAASCLLVVFGECLLHSNSYHEFTSCLSWDLVSILPQTDVLFLFIFIFHLPGKYFFFFCWNSFSKFLMSKRLINLVFTYLIFLVECVAWIPCHHCEQWTPQDLMWVEEISILPIIWSICNLDKVLSGHRIITLKIFALDWFLPPDMIDLAVKWFQYLPLIV